MYANLHVILKENTFCECSISIDESKIARVIRYRKT